MKKRQTIVYYFLSDVCLSKLVIICKYKFFTDKGICVMYFFIMSNKNDGVFPLRQHVLPPRVMDLKTNEIGKRIIRIGTM